MIRVTSKLTSPTIKTFPPRKLSEEEGRRKEEECSLLLFHQIWDIDWWYFRGGRGEGEKKKNALYSCFIKSGTLIGGTLEGEEEKDQMVTEDMSKALTDDELVKACGGLTAHKGARHGHKMDAKLQRVKEAERRYMEEFEENQRKKEESSKIKKKKRKSERSVDSTNEIEDEIEDIESQKCK